MKWTRRFLEAARFFSTWSDDRTKIGAVAVQNGKEIVATGFNGYPSKTEPSEEMKEYPLKAMSVVHAEANLVCQAASKVIGGATVYVNHLCCARCAGLLVNSGVAKVVSLERQVTKMDPVEFDLAKLFFDSKGVELVLVSEEEFAKGA